MRSSFRENSAPIDESEPAATLPAAFGKLANQLIDPTVVLSFSRPGFAVHSLTFAPGDLQVDLSAKRCLLRIGPIR